MLSSAIRKAGMLALAAILFAAPVCASAQDSDPYTVERIPVDIERESASIARDEALADAQRTGLDRLFERLVVSDDLSRVPSVSGAEAESYVDSVSIARERSSSTRYIGEINVGYSRARVRDLLGRRGIHFSETPAPPVLVLPVLDVAGAVALWDEPNEWFDAWRQAAVDEKAERGLVPVVLPEGDLADAATASAEQVAAGEDIGVRTLATRYGAPGAIVAHAGRGEAGGLRIELTPVADAPLVDPVSIDVAPRADESREDLFARARDQAERAIEDAWKQETLDVDALPQERLEVRIPVEDLSDLLTARRELENLPAVTSEQLVVLNRREATVAIRYFGGREKLDEDLAKIDRRLVRIPGGWLLEKDNPNIRPTRPEDAGAVPERGGRPVPEALPGEPGGTAPTGPVIRDELPPPSSGRAPR